jgi:hypothetical protein
LEHRYEEQVTHIRYKELVYVDLNQGTNHDDYMDFYGIKRYATIDGKEVLVEKTLQITSATNFAPATPTPYVDMNAHD